MKGHQILAMLRNEAPADVPEDGPVVHRMHLPAERYVIDFDRALGAWQQYDTSQDAHYFGVWVHVGRREVLTYAEGDWSLETYMDAESFAAGLKRMAEFYGDPPPAFVAIGQDGTRTEFYDERPGGEL